MLPENTRLMLAGLKTVADYHNKALRDLTEAVKSLTKETESFGYSDDFVYDDNMSPEDLWKHTESARSGAMKLEPEDYSRYGLNRHFIPGDVVPSDEAPNRYHLTEPTITIDGKSFGRGWLLISEEEYQNLTTPKKED